MGNIELLPYNNAVADAMFNAKLPELSKVAIKYQLSLEKLKAILDKELSDSKMKTGACNTALDFLIIKTLNENYLYKSIEIAIEDVILASAIYYANVLGESDYI